jgi:DNA-binding SARP family transcriptional activator
MTPQWRIELFGGLRAVSGDRVVSHFRTHKAGALLAYLAYYRRRSHPREVLIELLWPESTPAAGRCNLRTELCRLRAQLEPSAAHKGQVILADRASVQLNPSVCTTDIASFESAVQAARLAGDLPEREQQLFRAMALYQGELLPSFFEDWVLLERQWLAETAFQAQSQLRSRLVQSLDDPSGPQALTEATAREDAHHNMNRLLITLAQAEGVLRLPQHGLRPATEGGAADGEAGEAMEMRLWKQLQQVKSCVKSLQEAIDEVQAMISRGPSVHVDGRGTMGSPTLPGPVAAAREPMRDR